MNRAGGRCPVWAVVILYLLTVGAVVFCTLILWKESEVGSPIPAAAITLLCPLCLMVGLRLRFRPLVGAAAAFSCLFVGLLLVCLFFMITPVFILGLLAFQLHLVLIPSFRGMGALALPALAVALLSSTTAFVLLFDRARYEKKA